MVLDLKADHIEMDLYSLYKFELHVEIATTQVQEDRTRLDTAIRKTKEAMQRCMRR